MWAIADAVVPPEVGYQVHVSPALSWVRGLCALTGTRPLSLNTSWHSHVGAAGSGCWWFCSLLNLASEECLMELHWPPPELTYPSVGINPQTFCSDAVEQLLIDPGSFLVSSSRKEMALHLASPGAPCVLTYVTRASGTFWGAAGIVAPCSSPIPRCFQGKEKGPLCSV